MWKSLVWKSLVNRMTEVHTLHPREWIIPVILAVFLVAMSRYDYLVFHTLAEFFSIIIAMLMAVIAWHTFPYSQNHFLAFLASGYFWIACLDGFHALVYKGMDIFPVPDANSPTQFWIVARFAEAVLLLAAPHFLARAAPRRLVFATFGLGAVAMCAAIMTGYFPYASIEGHGLTRFKIAAEYVIVGILAGALYYLTRKRGHLPSGVYGLMAASIVLTMGSELAFTFYVSVFGLSNLVGPIFKFFSFWLVYVAIVRVTLQEPYALLRREIAERKWTEQVLAERNDQLERFTFIASHDLMEPLRKIRAFGARLMTRSGALLPPESRGDLERMIAAVSRLENLVDDLLTYTRLNTRAEPFVPTDLDDLVRKVVAEHQIVLDESGGQIDFRGLPTIEADPVAMRSLFANLVDNAVKFRRDDQPPEVEIVGMLHDGKCRITIRDNGIGFDRKYRERIFGVFQRLHGQAKYSGTGMGLAICRRVVQRHGGTLEADAVPGAGATFTLDLPLNQQTREAVS